MIRKRVYTQTIFFILFCCYSLLAQQSSITYTFNDNFNSVEGNAPPLTVLGKQGEIKEEKLPQLGGLSDRVYLFEKNNGLQFDNKKANGFLNASFTVELYFRLDSLKSWKRIIDFKNRKSDNGCYIFHGKLNFFNLDTGKKAPIQENQYIHYVYSRDQETKTIRMFVDGEPRLEFVDKNDEGVLDQDQVINFFYDDLVVNHEASAGAVAFIRLYDRVMTPVFIRKRFRDLAVKEKDPELVSAPPASTTPASPPSPKSTAPISKNMAKITGKVFHPEDMSALSNANVVVRKKDNDSVIAQTTTTNGSYEFVLPARQHYLISAQKAGYQTKSIPVYASRDQEEVVSLFSMNRETYTTPLAVLPFSQSKDELEKSTLQALDQLLKKLKEEPELRIRLEGHTDNVGDFNKNLTLSLQRASIVRAFLIQNGINPSRLEEKGYGSARPIASNSTEKTRQQNRRVEVWGITKR